MKRYLPFAMLLICNALFAQQALDTNTFSTDQTITYDHVGPGFLTLKFGSGQYQIKKYNSAKQEVAVQTIALQLPVANTSFYGLRFFPNSTKCLIIAKNRINPTWPIGINGPYAYHFVVYDYQSQQVLANQVDTFNILNLKIVPHTSSSFYMIHTERTLSTETEMLKCYLLNDNLQYAYINTIPMSMVASYGFLDECYMESDGDRTFVMTRAEAGFYMTEQYDEYFNLVQTETATGYAQNLGPNLAQGIGQHLLYKRLNSDSILIINQYRDNQFNFTWEIGWWKSPLQPLSDTIFKAPLFDTSLELGNTYATGANRVLLDPQARQILIFAAPVNSQVNDLYYERIYYFDYQFNLLCEDSMSLPDIYSKYGLALVDQQSYLAHYQTASIEFKPVYCQASILPTQDPPEADSNEPTQLVLYPNPSGGAFQIVNPDKALSKISIYTSIGNKLREIESSDELIQVELLGLPKGLYQLQLDQNGQTQLVTIMIQ